MNLCDKKHEQICWSYGQDCPLCLQIDKVETLDEEVLSLKAELVSVRASFITAVRGGG